MELNPTTDSAIITAPIILNLSGKSFINKADSDIVKTGFDKLTNSNATTDEAFRTPCTKQKW